MNLEYYRNNFPFLTNILHNIKANNRLSHAYIINCDNKNLRNDFTLFFAKLILCQETDTENTPCDKCSSCEKINKGIYPDLYTLFPTSKTRQIPIGENSDDEDTLRWFQSKFSMSSVMQGGLKVGIIHEADRMVTQAQNAFLKTLEEPPVKTFLILSTANPNSLLPTVNSRCQTLNLITNKCEYNFNNSSQIFSILEQIVSDNTQSLESASEIANKLIEMFNELYSEAEANINQRWSKKIEQSKEFESSAAKKRFKNKLNAAIMGEYRLLRATFLDAIYTWFSQLYQLSLGFGLDNLENPEIMSENFTNTCSTSPKSTFFYLEAVEKLLNYMRYNIDETLALQEFVLNSTMNKKS